jgi:hypothetical protein
MWLFLFLVWRFFNNSMSQGGQQMKKLLVIITGAGPGGPGMAQSQLGFLRQPAHAFGYYDASENYTIAPGPAQDGTIAAPATSKTKGSC